MNQVCLICDSLTSFQVVYNVGLCICLYDITKLEDSYIFPGDGASHTKGKGVDWAVCVRSLWSRLKWRLWLLLTQLRLIDPPSFDCSMSYFALSQFISGTSFFTLSSMRSLWERSNTAVKKGFTVRLSLFHQLLVMMSSQHVSEIQYKQSQTDVELTLTPLCVTVTMGFFDDILIPPESLQQPAKLYPFHIITDMYDTPEDFSTG